MSRLSIRFIFPVGAVPSGAFSLRKNRDFFMDYGYMLTIVILISLTIGVVFFYNLRMYDDLRRDMDWRFDGFRADTDRRFAEVHEELKEIKTEIREIRQFLLRLIPIPEPPKESPK